MLNEGLFIGDDQEFEWKLKTAQNRIKDFLYDGREI